MHFNKVKSVAICMYIGDWENETAKLVLHNYNNQ